MKILSAITQEISLHAVAVILRTLWWSLFREKQSQNLSGCAALLAQPEETALSGQEVLQWLRQQDAAWFRRVVANQQTQFSQWLVDSLNDEATLDLVAGCLDKLMVEVPRKSVYMARYPVTNAQYRRFVEAGIRDLDAAFIDTKNSSRFCIGSETRQEQARAMYLQRVQESDIKEEDVSFQRTGSYQPVEDVLGVALEVLDVPEEVLTRRSMNSIVRPVVAYALCQYAGCTQRQAAQVMDLHSGVAVSLQIKRLHEKCKTDRQLEALLMTLKQRLSP